MSMVLVGIKTQEAGAPHREYINRRKENEVFTPM